MVICHALTGSSDVADWWGPLIGPGKAFDPTRYFIICLNSLGSPYGSASPVTINPDTHQIFGPEFPLTTVRDDVNLHKLVLDDLGVSKIAAVIGGSMGGMLTLEWTLSYPDLVGCFVALATSARHSAWCISWGETQRQCIYSDPKYEDGYYSSDDPPISGLGAARMAALLTYRSRNSFESRFGRETQSTSTAGLKRLNNAITSTKVPISTPSTPVDLGKSPSSASISRQNSSVGEENWALHNEGHRTRKPVLSESSSPSSIPSTAPPTVSSSSNKTFTAQSYLRYQSNKFTSRFDANCYIAITRKLDTHDISRNRGENIEATLATIVQPALIMGITSDGLFTFAEQEIIASNIPNAQLYKIDSPEGHDAFLLEFDEVNTLIVDFLKKKLPEIYSGEPIGDAVSGDGWEYGGSRSSVFGEAEADGITTW
ncbi:homoserine O-acetyltransferase [Nadsonia fulvescens var. elongata DSM 6958]|uniref:Homoserine O-acetyltransferase n=1 Tax=Nadsonia fulvescens var. elongata DSM 6958 TaxID=857566 RepID=A0A1E3PTA4_9ASCO|nr:homoserine O-acetyltransferase [Nadsonia fulvescens var. elongata DSM 6958]